MPPILPRIHEETVGYVVLGHIVPTEVGLFAHVQIAEQVTYGVTLLIVDRGVPEGAMKAVLYSFWLLAGVPDTTLLSLAIESVGPLHHLLSTPVNSCLTFQTLQERLLEHRHQRLQRELEPGSD